MSLKPFFKFYGGKWRAAPHYPAPRYGRIIEPFAGAAGYSVRYFDRKIVLVECDPIIAATWRYLINVSPSEILALPDLCADQSVDDLGEICQEAKWLIGWWLNAGSAQPKKRPGHWMRQEADRGGEGWGAKGGQLSWGERVRIRIASQVDDIRHWKLLEADYAKVPNGHESTWFVDPPYQKAGKHYRFGPDRIDFAHLGQWAAALPGQVIVCENEGADWLPFRPFMEIKASEAKHGGKTSKEAIWTNDPMPAFCPECESRVLNCSCCLRVSRDDS